MKKSYRDCLNRIACYADGATGLVEHEYKKVKTKTIVPVGGEYFIERDKTYNGPLVKTAPEEIIVNTF